MKADIARSVGPQTTWDGPTDRPEGRQGQVDRLRLADPEFERQRQLGARRRRGGQGARLEVHPDGRQGHRHRRRRCARPGDRAQARRDHPRLGLDREQQDADQAGRTTRASSSSAGTRPTSRARSPIRRSSPTSAPIPTRSPTPPANTPSSHSNGTAGAEVISDRQYPIVVTKSDGIEKAIKECTRLHAALRGQRPVRRSAAAHAGLINSLLQRFGDKLGYILTFNEVYFDFAVPTLKAAGIDPGAPPHLIAAGDGSESAYQRIRNGQYQIATVPEPAVMHGWQLIDELNRAFNDAAAERLRHQGAPRDQGQRRRRRRRQEPLRPVERLSRTTTRRSGASSKPTPRPAGGRSPRRPSVPEPRQVGSLTAPEASGRAVGSDRSPQPRRGRPPSQPRRPAEQRRSGRSSAACRSCSFFKTSPEATIPDVADAVGLSRSTTYRHRRAAARARLPRGQCRAPAAGGSAARRSSSASSRCSRPTSCRWRRSCCAPCCEMAGEAVNLAVFDADSMVLLYREQGPQSVTISLAPRLAPADACELARQGLPRRRWQESERRVLLGRLALKRYHRRHHHQPGRARPRDRRDPGARLRRSTAANSRRRSPAAPPRSSTIAACRSPRSASPDRPSGSRPQFDRIGSSSPTPRGRSRSGSATCRRLSFALGA